MNTYLRGTRTFDVLFDTSRRRRKERQSRGAVGTCRICGEPVRWGESYHVTGSGLVHLRCEWSMGG